MLPTIERGIPRTLSLAIGAALIWLVSGVAIGVLSAIHQGRWVDRVLTVLALGGSVDPDLLAGRRAALPAHVPLPLVADLQLDPARRLRAVHPEPARMGGAPDPALDRARRRLDRLLRAGGAGTRCSRRAARTTCARRGRRASPTGACSMRHTLRTCLIPVVTLFGLDFGAAVGGTVILIEPIFGIEGVGQYAQESVAHLDLPPLMALTLYGAFFVVIVKHAGRPGLRLARPAHAGTTPREGVGHGETCTPTGGRRWRWRPGCGSRLRRNVRHRRAPVNGGTLRGRHPRQPRPPRHRHLLRGRGMGDARGDQQRPAHVQEGRRRGRLAGRARHRHGHARGHRRRPHLHLPRPSRRDVLAAGEPGGASRPTSSTRSSGCSTSARRASASTPSSRARTPTPRTRQRTSRASSRTTRR